MTSLADPITLRRGPALPNRLALAPMTNTQSHPDGTLSDLEHEWLVARARGGFGLTMTAAAFVHPAGKAWTGQLGVSDDEQLPGLTRLADAIRAAGSVSSVQLHHAGMRADRDASGLPLFAPWADQDAGVQALTTDEIHTAIDDFATAAARAERAGWDGVEIHGAHSYLLCQFLDARNQRGDGYGGAFDQRARIIHEVIDAVFAAVGPDFQVGLRLSPERFGVQLDEMVQLTADVLARGDLDYVDLSLWDVTKLPVGAEDGPLLIDHFLDLPRHGTALGVAGNIAGAAEAQAVLDRGADLAFIGMGAIVDRSFAQRALADPGYRSPEFPVTKDALREQVLGEPFVEYFSTTWPHLVSE